MMCKLKNLIAALVMLPSLQAMSAVVTPADAIKKCQTFVGDFSLACTGEIPKIDELSRIRTTLKDCYEISFILEGKNTVTGRVFFPSNKEFAGGTQTENMSFNDNSIKTVVTRTAKWDDDFSNLEMITTTTASDATGKILSSGKIVLNLISNPDGKLSLAMVNNSGVPGSAATVDQQAICSLISR